MPTADRFIVARNPDGGSSLPYLLRLPTEGGLVLKAREPWPTSSRVYCHPAGTEWPADAEIVEEVPVRLCRRRGSAIDLVLDRSRNNRAQFVFTEVRARPAIFWQTAKVARAARPGVRVPARRASGLDRLEILVDTRERYPYRFAGRSVDALREHLPAGDYAVGADGLVAAVERKSLQDLAKALSDGSLGFVMSELASLPASAVVVEARYSELFKVGGTMDYQFPLQVFTAVYEDLANPDNDLAGVLRPGGSLRRGGRLRALLLRARAGGLRGSPVPGPAAVRVQVGQGTSEVLGQASDRDPDPTIREHPSSAPSDRKRPTGPRRQGACRGLAAVRPGARPGAHRDPHRRWPVYPAESSRPRARRSRGSTRRRPRRPSNATSAETTTSTP